MRRPDSNSRRPNDWVHPAAVAANLRGTVAQAHGAAARTYGPEGQYSSEVQQRPHDLTHSASSRCMRASVNKASCGYCAEFGTKRSQVQILSPRQQNAWSASYSGFWTEAVELQVQQHVGASCLQVAATPQRVAAELAFA